MAYHELSIEERSTIQVSLAKGLSIRAIARLMQRFPSTISREQHRNRNGERAYQAHITQQFRQHRRFLWRQCRKLVQGSERFEMMCYLLRQRFSPEQIAGKLRYMDIPNLKNASVSRETIYSVIYALSVGELRKELIH